MSYNVDEDVDVGVDLQSGLDDVRLDDPTVEDDNDLALRGVIMLLNNKWDESLALFEKFKEQSVIMHYGAAFVVFIRALTAFEEEKLAQSKKGLDEVEKRCKDNDGLFRRLKRRMKQGSQLPSDVISQEDQWIRRIIVADTLLFQAVASFSVQTTPSLLKGGWLLRKAWKIYEKVYQDISQHHVDGKKFGKVKVKVDISKKDFLDDDSDMPADRMRKLQQEESAGDTEEGVHEVMSREVLTRLLGAVSFGYGLFQVIISLVPEKVLKLIEFLGFHGDREAGLNAIRFSMESTDMRAPLAMLAMLWYHVIIYPLFAETLPEEAMKEATDLVDKYQAMYPESTVFLLFKGKLCRIKSDIDGALQAYEQAIASEGQEEVRNAAAFELAWCNMMKQNYDLGYDKFSYLIEHSRWSKCFYTYMMGLCAGANGKQDQATQHMKAVSGLVRDGNNQIEAFVNRRSQQLKKVNLTKNVCELFILELIYLWNGVYQCSQQMLEKMLAICGAVEDKKYFHLRSLVEGALYKYMNDVELAEQCYREAIARQEGLKVDQHIAAHAYFELGCYYIKSEDTREEGRKMLLKAKDGFKKEYDFENRLNIRITYALKSLENK